MQSSARTSWHVALFSGSDCFVLAEIVTKYSWAEQLENHGESKAHLWNAGHEAGPVETHTDMRTCI